MTMFFFATAVIVLCSLVGRIQCEDPIETVSASTLDSRTSPKCDPVLCVPPECICHDGDVRGDQNQVNVSQSCSPYETECGLGCCPFSHGVCCIDGFECCQNGQTCIPFIGICIGAVNDNGYVSLTSSKTARIRTTAIDCPTGTTTCGPDKCCRFEQGTCCSDGQHCCPNGYKCDLPNHQCKRDASNEVGRNSYSLVSSDKPLRKRNRKSFYKSCPGGNRICPNHMSCCIQDNGNWGCCPNVSLTIFDQCCTTYLGFFCCPDIFPLCTFFGCL